MGNFSWTPIILKSAAVQRKTLPCTKHGRRRTNVLISSADQCKWRPCVISLGPYDYTNDFRVLRLISSSSRSISSSGRRCPDVAAILMPVLRHSACRCHRTKRICDVFLLSVSWLSSASFPGYHSLHYSIL